MHPKKAETLARFEEISRMHDEGLTRSFNVITSPRQFGWERSLLTAAIVVPVTGISAVLTDLTHALLSRTDDSAWDVGGSSPPARTDEPNG